MQEFLHLLRTIQFAFTFVCFSVDTVLMSIATDQEKTIPGFMQNSHLPWFLLPDFITLFLSGYYVFTVTKQWNKNSSCVDVWLNILLIVLWICYGSSKAYIYSKELNGFSLLTVIYGWFNVILYSISAIIYAECFSLN